MRFSSFAAGLLVSLLALPLRAQTPVRLTLAPELLVSDSAADPRLPAEPRLREAFEKRAAETFPGQLMRLSADDMISPDERVLVLVPTLRAARLTREVTAGVIDRYEAVVVGDLSLLDPWTNANLFSATRMVAVGVDLGRSQASRREELLAQAFDAAVARWLEACLAQLKTQAAPFVLEGGTLGSPAAGLKGGIWPFGRDRGVKRGTILRGQGHFAKVSDVTPKYALLQDVADSSRKLPAGERYTLTVVDKPAERPEPTVALAWRGAPPRPPQGSNLRTLDADAFLGLLGNYLSQAGGLRLLPGDPRRPAAKAQLQRLHDHIARHSQLTQANFLSLEQRETAQAALEAPDRRVDLGVLGAYHGTRKKADGSLEHYYRIHLGAAIFPRVGEGDGTCYPLRAFLEHTEELAQVEQAGIRELDAHAAWFTVCRNAVIRLAAKVQADLLAIPAGDLAGQEGGIDAQRQPRWKGPAPARFTPLQWFRPAGELKDSAGRSLGPLLLPQAPSKGFLNLACLAAEKTVPGDVLRFSGSPAPEPLLALAPPLVENPPSWLPEGRWLAPMAAQALMGPGGCRFLLVEEPGSALRMALHATALASTTAGDTTTFTGQWRVRLQAGNDPEPLLKFGLQTDHAQKLENPAQALRPLDTGAWAMDYLRDTLRRLAESATKKNLNQAVLAAQQESR
ncbi:hypothetical protein [Geothrix sp. PMB-07]|uniref:hypothetical protein n=1 Tax=Geothrix sp. PMB-07 TaxID=3068640 RepID=UPI002740563F|nr:hypothetical protein [Geothrix sp. PMB-07]WLT30449.1 hypothetical protein Q9293_12045 [Geothrix sp. PMB-07]